MPGTPTTGSPNIALLDSQIIADLCLGKFYVDLSPSIYIGSGADNVLGANVKIVNPFGVIVKPYGPNYEIAPALSGGMDAVINFNIPTQASNYQYGKYTISVQLYDADGTSWVVTKPASVCEPDKNNKTKSYGTVSATLTGSCKDGKVYVIADSPPNYNGKQVESQVNDFTLEYPTGSGLDPLDTDIGSFSVQLYEGVYLFTGEICATYNFGDSVYVKVKYKIKVQKTIRCLVDLCGVGLKLATLNAKIKTNCTLAEKEESASITLDALLLLKSIELAAECGEDASDYITELEQLLGIEGVFDEGTPIINTSPAKDFIITGCNVEKTTVGLTDSYVIENYEYVVGVVDNGGVLIVAAAVLDGCVKTQTITFSISTAYTQIKNLITSDTTFWTTLFNTIINGGGVTSIQTILNNISECCDCSASISGAASQQVGADVKLTWTGTGELSTDVYLDGIFKGNVLSDVDEFTFEGAADGQTHDYVLLPKCSNNKYGTFENGSFGYIGCPSISPPVVSSNNVNGVECPYDLTQLESAPPAGITIEWHTANNTSASSLVPDATNVSSGVYYAFAKDADGCFSTATTVTLICEEATSCTAPQNLTVSHLLLCNFLVAFQSAAFPPPANSYTVKRRLFTDPDVDGSYTTIGTPIWNAGLNRWVICDNTAVNNRLYVWKAISNCGGSPPTAPSTTYQYANITCPSITITPHVESLDYSYNLSGGQVDKYEVKLYDSTGTTLIHTDTHVPSFSNPTTGTFTYLSAETTYKIRLRVWIGSYYKDCDFVIGSTSCAGKINVDGSTAVDIIITNITVDGNQVTDNGGGYPILAGESREGEVATIGNFDIVVTLTSTTVGQKIRIDGANPQCLNVTVNGAYTFTDQDVSCDAPLTIFFEDGPCT